MPVECFGGLQELKRVIEEMRANLKISPQTPIFEAVASRGDGVLDGAVGGHDQDLDLGRDRLGGLEQVLAGHAGHAQVGDHHLDRMQAQDLERLLPALGDAHVHVLLGQHLLQGVEDAGLVVDDKDGGQGRLRRQGHGGSLGKQTPLPWQR